MKNPIVKVALGTVNMDRSTYETMIKEGWTRQQIVDFIKDEGESHLACLAAEKRGEVDKYSHGFLTK